MKVNFIFICIALVYSKTVKQTNPRFDEPFSFPLLTHYLVANCNFSVTKDNPTTSNVKVGIIGAGISGLYAALLLQDLNIDYEILEASDRTGGRIYTHYFNERKYEYDYVELGAKRFPAISEYDRFVGKQNWSLVSYVNKHLKEKNKIKLVPFASKQESNVFYMNGKSVLRSVVENSSDLFGFGKSDGGFIDDHYTSKNALFWKNKAIDYVFSKLNADFDEAVNFFKNNDKSFRDFLTVTRNAYLNYTSDVVDWIENFDADTGGFSDSLYDVLMYDKFFRSPLLTIDGGNSKIIKAMVKLLKNKPKLNTKVVAIDQSHSHNLNIKTTNGTFQYSHVIVTPTFSALRKIDFKLKLRLKKRIAMRSQIYEHSTKIGLVFNSRFWEDSKLMNGTPIFGGISVTDLPIRQILYPSYGFNCSNCRGVIVSYLWDRDATALLPYTEKEIVDLCLKNLAEIHGSIVFEKFEGSYVIMDWAKNPYTVGAFSAFAGGQFTSYYPHLITPEANGRMHFAGETLSVFHAWSIGSLKSSYRAVKDILTVNKMKEKVEELKLRWSVIDEPDFTHFHHV